MLFQAKPHRSPTGAGARPKKSPNKHICVENDGEAHVSMIALVLSYFGDVKRLSPDAAPAQQHGGSSPLGHQLIDYRPSSFRPSNEASFPAFWSKLRKESQPRSRAETT